MSERKFITALYGRTSKDDPRRVTIEIQQQALRQWVGRDALVASVVDEYWDDGVTGKTPIWERPEGRRLLQDVNSGRIESVAVAYADRFGRTLLDGLQAVKVLEDKGVKLVAINDGWDSRRNDSPLYFQFRMMMAEEEHRRISQRMSDGKNRAMERDNAPPGGPVVFGYRLDEHGRFVPDPVESPIVIRIFEMAVAGYSNQQILTWVNTTGARAGRKFQKRAVGSEPVVVSTHKNAQWHLTKIGKILRSRVYLGERRWGTHTFPCSALVDQQTFDKVQLVVNDKNRKFGIGKADPERGLLSGLLVCANCGGKFYHRATATKRLNGDVDRYQMYCCDTMRRSGACKAKLLRVDQLDEQVWKIVESYLVDPEKFVRKALAADERLGGELTSIDKDEASLSLELNSIEQEVQSVWSEQKENGWPMAWITPRLNELNNRRERLSAALAEVRRQRAQVFGHKEQSSAMTAALASIRARLAAGLSQLEKYEMVRRSVSCVMVTTTGSGRTKRADISVQIYTGDRLTTASRKLPKDWYYGSCGDAKVNAGQAHDGVLRPVVFTRPLPSQKEHDT